MPTFNNFEDIEAWQKARELCREIYSVSNKDSFAKDFGLKDQIRRASVSIMSNIAEGFERSGTGEFIYFLTVAKGSTGEVKSQLYVALDQNYINKELFNNFYKLATEISRILAGLINYLNKTKFKGIKYK